MPVSKRILLLSVSAGAGHGRAAEALRAQAHSDGITAEHIDVMTWAYFCITRRTRCRAMRYSPNFTRGRASQHAQAARYHRGIRSRAHHLHALSSGGTAGPSHQAWPLRAAGMGAGHGFRSAPDVGAAGHARLFRGERRDRVSYGRARHSAHQSVGHRHSHAGGFPGVGSRPTVPANSVSSPDKTTLLLMTGGAGIAGGEQMIERLLTLPAIFRSSRSPVKMRRS